MLRRTWFWAAAGLLLACGSSPSAPAPDLRLQQAQQRLIGSWVLTSFTPDQALEPVIAALVQAQLGTMRVTFTQQDFIAEGSGLSVTRRYRIVGAELDRIQVVVLDDPGVSYDASGEFRGNELYFRSHTSPWSGQGILRREP